MEAAAPLASPILAAPILAFAAARPERTALVVGGDARSYGALVAGAERVAAGMAALPPRADGAPVRAALRLSNRVEVLEILLGAVMAGATAVILDPKWSAPQTAAALDVARPDVLFADHHMTGAIAVPDGYRAWAADGPEWTPRPVDPETPFLIGFTSGTSGRPKAFVRSQASWVATLAASRAEFGIAAGDGVLVPGPLAHGLGLYAAVEGLAAGATVHVLPRFDAAAALESLQGLDTLVAVPTMLVAMLDEAERRGAVPMGVRRVISSGAKLAPAVHARLATTFPAAAVFEYYGASELSFVSVAAAREGSPADSVGRPFHGVEVAIRDDAGRTLPPGAVGTVWVRSAMLSDGYVGPTDGGGFRCVDGWGSVGDRGWLDADGWLRLAGREGDMLITGGLNVYPAEVEGALRALPGVAEAVVFGLPDPYWGDCVTAALWPRGDAPLSAAALKAACRERLEAYKCPRRFLLARETPLTGSGKIARAAIRAWAHEGSPLLEDIP